MAKWVIASRAIPIIILLISGQCQGSGPLHSSGNSIVSEFIAEISEDVDHQSIGAGPITLSVVLGPDGVPKVVTGKATSYRVVWATFNPSMNATGWARLELHTNGSYSDETQVEAAGFVEGYLTAQMIWDMYSNVIPDYCEGSERGAYCKRLTAFLSSNMLWAQSQRELKTSAEREYWYQYRLIMKQLSSMMNAYNILAGDLGGKVLSLNDFLMLSIPGDLITLETVLDMPDRDQPRKFGHPSCSAIVKVIGNNEDIMFAHNTWVGYTMMLRIYKMYDIQISRGDTSARNAAVIPGARVGFSSYPLQLQSTDDFYTIGSGLAVMETTIENYNEELFKQVSFSSMLYYFRIQIANRLATNGQEWSEFFSMHNSGTYNNQWMVLDYKLFTPGRAPRPGAFTVLEQLPTYIHVEDKTATLNSQGYWPSYNAMFYPEVQTLGSMSVGRAKYGDFVVYGKAPRAKMFERDHATVIDLPSLAKLMRYNDYQHDEYSRCNCTPPYTAINAIAARKDLNTKDGKYEFHFQGYDLVGAIDFKITNTAMMKNLEAYIVSGPTSDQQPVFKWSGVGQTPPRGQPDAFDFEPFVAKWETEN